MKAELLEIPRDHENESALLASILVNNRVIMADVVASGVRRDFFHEPAHQLLWDEMFALHYEGKPIDVALLHPRLKAKETEAGEDATAFMYQVLREPFTPGHWEYYVEQLTEVRNKRRLQALSERLQRESFNGKPTTEIADDALRILEEIRAGSTAKGEVITYRQLTCAELAATEFATNYLIEWLVVEGQPLILAGPKKACKTTLLCALALALAMGGNFLGRFRVATCCRVLFMTGESGLPTIKETLSRIAEANGYSLADVEGLIISDQLPMLGHPDHLAALRKKIQENESAFLIIDPTYLALPTDGNEGSLFAMGALLRETSELCQELGVTLCLCHHTKKGIADPYQPPELEGIAWAGFQEFARQWLLLARREQFKPGTGEHKLWLSAGGSAGHSSLWALNINEGEFDGTVQRQWHVEVQKATEAIDEAQEAQAERKAEQAERKRAAQLEAARTAIAKSLVKFPNGETKSVIKDRACLKQGPLDAAIASLLLDETILHCRVKRENNQSYDGYKLNDSPERQATL